MGLRQSIVVVNQYSVPQPDGGGSRGSTPGSYVTRYMARAQATESLAPIRRLRAEDFITRYMARESAVERTGASRHEVKTAMKQAQGEGGVAFGYGSVSLSDEQLKTASRDIQRHFENGKTVLKTVLSFDEAYLKQRGIVEQDFHCAHRGDYRGHIDQMKLRMAIMHGLDRMSSGSGGFDDLRYVGVIQVDTEHVHCHLAMVDAGPGRLAKDGTQRGKLLDKHKSRLRRGVDAWLDEKQTMAHLSSAVGYERRNVITFVKRWAHDRIKEESLPQFLLACLPEDRSLWRAGSRDRRMRKANELVGELVQEQLARPGSPLPAALERIADYANERLEREHLSTDEWQRLVAQGRSRIEERAVNGVYQMLRALPESELRVRTPMLEVMGMDYAQAALLSARGGGTDDQEDLASFGFRLRSYSSRLRHHAEKADSNSDLRRQWERADDAGVADEDSRPLHDFYSFEEDYHRRLTSKYRHFLPFIGDGGQWADRQHDAAEYGRRLLALQALRADQSLRRMKDPIEAERLGREVYGQPGGRLMTDGASGRAALDARIGAMTRVYEERLDGLRADLAGAGLVLRLGSGGTPGDAMEIRPGSAHPFDEVKALDLHHLRYDFAADVEIGPNAARTFLRASALRRRLLVASMDYLDGTGQSEAIADLPVDDVGRMTRMAEELTSDRPAAGPGGRFILRSRIAELRAERAKDGGSARSDTVTLDAGLALRVQAEIDRAVGQADRVGQPDEITGAGARQSAD